MPWFFTSLYLVTGLWGATRIRATAIQYMAACPNRPEYAERERIACWFQLVLALLLVVSFVRGAARWSMSRSIKGDPMSASHADAESPTNHPGELRSPTYEFFAFDSFGKEANPPAH
jgi:hypothetical protein